MFRSLLFALWHNNVITRRLTKWSMRKTQKPLMLCHDDVCGDQHQTNTNNVVTHT